MIPSGRAQQSLDRRRTELDRELVRFVDFGVLLDRRTRRYLAEIIRHRALGDGSPTLPTVGSSVFGQERELDVSYAKYFADAVDQIFSDEALVDVCRKQGALGAQVATETLRWMRQSFRQLDQRHVHKDEQSRLDFLAQLPLTRFVETYRYVLEDLGSRYAPSQIDADFYYSAFRDVIGSKSAAQLDAPARQRVEMLLHDLLAAWDALLSAKVLTTQLGELTEARDEFVVRMTERIEEHRRIQAIFTPFVDYLDRGWDLSRELWEQADLDILAEYASLLEKEEDIRRLAAMLGRMHEAELETEEEEITRTVVTRQWIMDETQRAEIVGVRESDDLSQVLSSEIALSGDPLLEDRFLQKLVDKRLLTFQLANRRLVEGTKSFREIHTRSQRRARGPFIICVDTSYSMAGRAELLAKVLTFGIMRVAMEEDRDAYLINFSVHIKTLDLRDAGRQLDVLAEFLRMSFHGGTDVTLALSEGLQKLDEGRYEDADVLVVSDFIMFRVAPRLLERVRSHRHNKGTRFHALTFHDMPSPQLVENFDTTWFSDPEHPGVIEKMTSQVGTIRESSVTS